MDRQTIDRKTKLDYTFIESNIIINGTPNELRMLTDPNRIGSITDVITGELITNVTPITIIAVRGKREWREQLSVMYEIGGDLDMVINFYGKDTSVRSIVERYESRRY